MREPSHNAVDFAQRTAPARPGGESDGDDDERLIEVLRRDASLKYLPWDSPDFRAKFLAKETPEEGARQEQPEESALSREADDRFWADPEGWRRAQPPRKL